MRPTDHLPGAIADKAGAQQRGRPDIGIAWRNGQAIACVGDSIVGIAAIPRVTGELRMVAQVLAIAAAEAAAPAGPAKPGHTHAIPRLHGQNTLTERLDDAHNFMTGNQGKLRRGKIAIDNMDIRPADAARANPDQHFPLSWLGARKIRIDRQVATNPGKDCGTHPRLPPAQGNKMARNRALHIMAQPALARQQDVVARSGSRLPVSPAPQRMERRSPASRQ